MSETEEDLRDLYQDLILDHGRHPRNFHALEGAQCEAVGHNPLCGDKIVLYLSVGGDGRVVEAAFQGEGCAISMAAASMMTDMLKGKTAAEAKGLIAYFEALCKGTSPESLSLALDEDDVARLRALSGVRHYPIRVKCAMLAWRTLEVALSPSSSRKTMTE